MTRHVKDPPGAANSGIERQARLLADRDVINAILHECDHADLVAIVAAMREGYQAPTPKGWFLPPTILSGGEVSPWAMPRPYGEPPDQVYEKGVVRQAVEPLISEGSVRPVDPDEAGRFRETYIGRIREWADSFTPRTFDWLLYHYPLGDKGNLLDRLCEIGPEIGWLRAGDEQAVRKVIAASDAFLREADRLAPKDDIATWYVGKDSEEDTEYWQDLERFGCELQAIQDRRFRKFQDREERHFDLLELGLGWDVVDTLSDIDSELGGCQCAPSPAVREVVKLIQEQTPDDQQAVAILSKALPSVDGQADQLVQRFQDALEQWRDICQQQKDDGPTGQAHAIAKDKVGQPTGQAESIGKQIQKAVEPILMGLDDGQRLAELTTLANSLRDAVDAERASLRQWSQFPLDVFPRPVADFIRLAAKAHSVDPSFVALPVLAVVAAALGNAWRCRIKDDFDVPPTLWCILVAKTGSNKSGPLALVAKPMWQDPPMPADAEALLAPYQGQYLIDDVTSEAVLARLGECPRG